MKITRNKLNVEVQAVDLEVNSKLVSNSLNSSEFLAFKLNFTSPLHISRGGDDYEKSLTTLHSDTIKSALYVIHRQIAKEPLEAKAFFDAFTISSAFPFYDKEYFFPKPFGMKLPKVADENGDDPKNAKLYKKIAYVGKEYFEKMITGKGEEATFTKDQVFGGKAFLASKKIENQDIIVFKSSIQTRVNVPRFGESDPTPYDVDRIFFGDKAGLYVLYQLNSPEVISEKHLKTCFELLGEIGVGTDKSVGNGQFTVVKDTFELKLPENGTYYMPLGLYCPTKEEISAESLNNSQYNLILRGGWLSNPENEANTTLHKSSIYMFQEGSIFPIASNPIGKCVDLKPERGDGTVSHPVLREGRPIFIPVIFNPKNQNEK